MRSSASPPAWFYLFVSDAPALVDLEGHLTRCVKRFVSRHDRQASSLGGFLDLVSGCQWDFCRSMKGLLYGGGGFF